MHLDFGRDYHLWGSLYHVEYFSGFDCNLQPLHQVNWPPQPHLLRRLPNLHVKLPYSALPHHQLAYIHG